MRGCYLYDFKKLIKFIARNKKNQNLIVFSYKNKLYFKNYYIITLHQRFISVYSSIVIFYFALGGTGNEFGFNFFAVNQ